MADQCTICRNRNPDCTGVFTVLLQGQFQVSYCKEKLDRHNDLMMRQSRQYEKDSCMCDGGGSITHTPSIKCTSGPFWND
jgi:hypothetical protein